MARNFRSSLVAFWRIVAARDPDRLEWDEHGHRRDGKPATCLHLRDSIPRPPLRHERPALTITSEFRVLREDVFGFVAVEVNKNGVRGHGRVVTCLDRDGRPLAAISYHLPSDTEAPLLVRHVAMFARAGDRWEPQRLWAQECVGVLLCYLTLAARELGMPDHIAFAPGPEARPLATKLGFVGGGPPKEYAAAKGAYMTWSPPKRL